MVGLDERYVFKCTHSRSYVWSRHVVYIPINIYIYIYITSRISITIYTWKHVSFERNGLDFTYLGVVGEANATHDTVRHYRELVRCCVQRYTPNKSIKNAAATSTISSSPRKWTKWIVTLGVLPKTEFLIGFPRTWIERKLIRESRVAEICILYVCIYCITRGTSQLQPYMTTYMYHKWCIHDFPNSWYSGT